MSRWLIYPLLILSLALAGGLYWLLFTPAGARFAGELINDRVEGITIGEIQGSFGGKLDVGSVTVTTESFEAQITDSTLSIDPFALLVWRLRLPELHIGDLDIRLVDSKGAPEEATTAGIQMPIAIDIVDGTVRRLAMQSGDFSEQVHKIETSFRLSGNRLAVEHLQATAEAGKLTASLDLLLSPPWDFTGFYQIRTQNLPLPGNSLFAAEGRLEGNAERVTTSGLTTSPQRLTYEASLAGFADMPALDAHLQAKSLDLAPFTGQAAHLLEPRLNLKGTLDNYTFDGKAGFDHPQTPPLDITVSGSGNRQNMRFTPAAIRVNKGTISANGTLGFEHGTFTGDIKARDLPLSLAYQPLDGNLDFDGTIERRSNGLLAVRLDQFKGNLPGRELTGALDWSGTDLEHWTLAARLVQGKNRLTLDGHDGRLAFNLAATELATLHPQLDGSLTAQGGFRLEPEARFGIAALDVQASGEALAFGSHRLERVEVRLPPQARAASATITDWHYGDTLVGSGKMQYTGDLDGGTVALEWTNPQLKTTLKASLNRTEDAVKGQLREGFVELMDKRWQSDRNVAFNASTNLDHIDIAPHCWRQGGARACLSVLQLDGDAGKFGFKVDDLPINVARIPFAMQGYELPSAFSARGELSIKVNGGLTASGPTARFDATVPRAEITWDEDEPPLQFGLKLAGHYGDNGVTAKLESTDAAAHHLAVDLTMPNVGNPSAMALQANLDGDFLPLVVAFIPRLSDGKGTLTADVRLDTRNETPVIGGRITTGEHASVAIPAAGIRLGDIRLAATASDQRTLKFSGSATSGEGRVTLDGHVNHPMGDQREIFVRIDGENFLTADRKDLELVSSPSIEITRTADLTRIGGTLTIPRGEVQLLALDYSTRRRSPDVQLADAESRATPLASTQLDLEISVLDQVHIAAFGLDAWIAGNLDVRQGAGSLPWAHGTLTLSRGTFTRYGQKLNIDRGRLVYSGPLNNPLVDVVASRTINTANKQVKVTLSISGPANNIQSQITSSPPMSDGNALSYLILGRPLQSASDQEGQNLSAAALGLGLKKALPITQEIANTLGLDEFDVKGDNLDSTAIVAGKRISTDLYVEYNYDVFSRVGGILFNYALTPHISIEAQSGAAKSLELIYSF